MRFHISINVAIVTTIIIVIDRMFLRVLITDLFLALVSCLCNSVIRVSAIITTVAEAV